MERNIFVCLYANHDKTSLEENNSDMDFQDTVNKINAVLPPLKYKAIVKTTDQGSWIQIVDNIKKPFFNFKPDWIWEEKILVSNIAFTYNFAANPSTISLSMTLYHGYYGLFDLVIPILKQKASMLRKKWGIKEPEMQVKEIRDFGTMITIFENGDTYIQTPGDVHIVKARKVF